MKDPRLECLINDVVDNIPCDTTLLKFEVDDEIFKVSVFTSGLAQRNSQNIFFFFLIDITFSYIFQSAEDIYL